jgi:hypothetical protein
MHSGCVTYSIVSGNLSIDSAATDAVAEIMQYVPHELVCLIEELSGGTIAFEDAGALGENVAAYTNYATQSGIIFDVTIQLNDSPPYPYNTSETGPDPNDEVVELDVEGLFVHEMMHAFDFFDGCGCTATSVMYDPPGTATGCPGSNNRSCPASCGNWLT